MDKEELYNDPQTEENKEEFQIDYAALAAKLWSRKVFIILFSFAFAVLGVVVSLQMKKKYTVSVTLAPEVQGKNSGGSLGGIASMLGMNSAVGSGGSDALNITLFPEICASTPFLTNLFDIKVTPYVTPKEIREGAKPGRPISIYKYISKEDEPKGWFAKFKESIFGKEEKEKKNKKVNPAQLTRKEYGVVNVLSRNISADVDKKTGITTITVTMDDPQIAAQVADTVCQRLQEYIINYRTKKAKEDYDYYKMLADEAHKKLVKAQAAYAVSVDFDRSVILQSVNSEKQRLQEEASLANQLYTQMEQQKEMAKAKIQELKPVFAVVQPATMPLVPSGTSRKMVVLGFCFLGFCLSAAWILFGAEFIGKFHTDLKEKIKEQNETEEAEKLISD